MKRLNRKKLIEKFEELRQGFASVLASDIDDVLRMSTEAYHIMANTYVVELGGESVETVKIRINNK